jgi:hypothetical protein
MALCLSYRRMLGAKTPRDVAMHRRILCVITSFMSACAFGATNAIAPSEEGLTTGDGVIQGDEGDAQAGTPAVEPDLSGALDGGTYPDGTGSSETPGPGAIPSCGGPELACTPPAGCTAAEHAGHTYFFCTTTAVWRDARATCQGAHSDLAIVDDQAENDFITSRLSAESWLGINDQETEGVYVWIVPGTAAVSGAPQSFAAWAAAQPDNCLVFGAQHCAMIQLDGTWNDVACSDGCFVGGPRAILCESY